MKKLISIAVVLIIFLGQFTLVGRANSNKPDIFLREVNPSSSQISLGDSFYLELNFTEDLYEELDSFTIDLPNINPLEPEKPEPVDGAKFVPNLAIVSSKTTTVESGSSVYIPLTIKNTSHHDAENISISAELDGESPLSIEGSGSENLRFLDSGKSRDTGFRISVDPNAESKTYPIKINFHFYNRYGTPFTGSETIYLKVENKNTSPLITVNKLDTIPRVAEPGKSTTVKISLVGTRLM